MNRITGRGRLAGVLRQSGELITVASAAGALGVSQGKAAKILWRWDRQGWLRRLRRGLYAPVPLDAVSQEQVLSDPWILVPELFDPAYIGGWSAAEYWDLTEQMFRSILVYTVQPIRPREQTIQGIPFILKRSMPEKIFLTRPVWRGNNKVQISEIHRTLVDLLDDPAVAGFIRLSNSCLENYLESEQADLPQVLDYVARLGNGAVFKRLGFLLSRLNVSENVLESCRSQLTAGNAKLDPAIPCRRLVKKWHLWIPKTWEEARAHD